MHETGNTNDENQGLEEVGWFVPDAGGALFIVPGTEAVVVAGSPGDNPTRDYYTKVTQPKVFDGKYSIGGYKTASDFIDAVRRSTRIPKGTFVYSDQVAPDWTVAASVVIEKAKVAAMEPKKKAISLLQKLNI